MSPGSPMSQHLQGIHTLSKFSEKIVLITGATDGIGMALAHHYREVGACLVLVGRRALTDLDSTFFDQANYCQTDLSEVGCEEAVAAWLAEKQIDRLDLVIHNAGVGFVGAVAEQPAQSIIELVAVNLVAPIALTHRLLPRVARAGGQLVYISSVASVMPGPEYAVYTATKAALDGFVRNLQIELAAADSPATAHLIHPGATRTNMHKKSGMPTERIDQTKFPPADKVAAQIAAMIDKKSRRGAVGASNRLIFATGRTLPGAIDGAMRRTAAKRGGDERLVQPSNSSRHCVITGAADGIGRALALAFAASGYAITGIDVDSDRAMRTQAEIINGGGAARFIIADLTSAAQIDRIIRQLAVRPPIDVLVHNAGISAVGSFSRQPLAPQVKVLDVNLVAPLLLTAGLLRDGRLLAGATIVCMASLSHFVGYPGAAVYAASKDGLVSYARSLSVALSADDIHLLTVFPGPTRTAHARRYSPDNRREASRMPPETLAKRIVVATENRRRTLIPSLGNRAFAVAGRLMPRVTEQLMRKTILEKFD